MGSIQVLEKVKQVGLLQVETATAVRKKKKGKKKKKKKVINTTRWPEIGVFFSHIVRRDVKNFPNRMKLGRIVAWDILHFFGASLTVLRDIVTPPIVSKFGCQNLELIKSSEKAHRGVLWSEWSFPVKEEFNCFITLYGKTLGRFPVEDKKWKLKEK